MAYIELSIHIDSLRNVATATAHTNAHTHTHTLAGVYVCACVCVICAEAEITNFGIIYYNMFFLQKGDCM